MANVVMFITEEYGYRHWLAIVTEQEFDAFVARWKTIKGLSCLVPINFLLPSAHVADRAEFQAAEENATAHGDRCVSAHIHESDDSSIEGVDYTIPEQDNFEIDGRVYTSEEVNDLYEGFNKITKNVQEARVTIPKHQPERTVTQLLLLKNRLMDVEAEVFGIRQKIDIVLNELMEHAENTKQITFEDV
jgi:hypothetical protein